MADLEEVQSKLEQIKMAAITQGQTEQALTIVRLVDEAIEALNS
jgi:hypothetical protein